MGKPVVMTLVGTRPEIIRLSCLVPELDNFTNHHFVHTGQNHDPLLGEVFYDDLGLRRPDSYLGVDTSSLGMMMGQTLMRVEELIHEIKPDAFMVLGDTNSAVGAIISERLGVPVYHMEAGNRSFDSNVPEELNRRLVDHTSTFNLPYTNRSFQNLLMEGIHPRFIQLTGSPMPEVLNKQRQKILSCSILSDLGLEANNYYLVSAHRQENVDSPTRAKSIFGALDALGREHGVRVVVSTHPRTRKRLEEMDMVFPNLEFLAPFSFSEYVSLQLNAICTFSDSGTVSEEAAILGIRAISIRDSIERPEALDSGHIILAGTVEASIRSALQLAMEQLPRSNGEPLPDGYETSNFSKRVTSFLFSTYHLAQKWKGIENRVG